MNVLESLTEALRQGYQVYERVPEGYLVRTRVRDRLALALVALRRTGLGFEHLQRQPERGRLDGR